MRRRVETYLGRRGTFLALFGCVYALIGYSYLTLEVTPLVRHALRLALRLAPLDAYGWAWIGAGVIAVVCGLFCPGRKTVGFLAAMLMPAMWSLIYLATWLDGDIPRGWVSAVVYVLLAAAVSVVAGMPEPAEFRKPQ